MAAPKDPFVIEQILSRGVFSHGEPDPTALILIAIDPDGGACPVHIKHQAIRQLAKLIRRIEQQFPNVLAEH